MTWLRGADTCPNCRTQIVQTDTPDDENPPQLSVSPHSPSLLRGIPTLSFHWQFEMTPSRDDTSSDADISSDTTDDLQMIYYDDDDLQFAMSPEM